MPQFGFGIGFSYARIPVGGLGPDTIAPVIQSLTSNTSILTLRYNEILDATSVPATTDFTVSGVSVTNVDVSGSNVVLTVSPAIEHAAVVTLSYTAGVNPIRDAAGNSAANLVSESVTNTTPDTTAPILTAASATATGQTTFDWGMFSDEVGPFYWILSSSMSQPTTPQIRAGQDHTGVSAVTSDSQAVVATGQQSGSGSGLTANTTYYFFGYQEDAAGNASNIVSDSFTTQAVAGPFAVDPQVFAFGTGTRAGEGAYTFGATNGAIASIGSLTGTNAAHFETPSVTAGQVSIAPASNGSVNQPSYNLTLRCYDGVGQTGNFVDVSLTVSTAAGRTIAATGDEGTDEIANVIGLSAAAASGLTVYLRPGDYNTNAAASLPVGNPGRIRFNDTLKNLTDTLTLTATDTNNKPRIERWTVWNQNGVNGDAGRITFDNIHFHRPVAEGPPTGSESDLVGFRGSFDAVDLVFRNCRFTSNVGLAREGYTVGSQITGIRLNNVVGVTIEDCEFANLIDGVTMQAADNVLIQRCIGHHCYADFIGIYHASRTITVRDNAFYAYTGDGASLHPDWIQLFSANSGNGNVRDVNVFGNVTFFTDEGFRMPPVISSSTPHAPVTNVSFEDTVGGFYKVPALSEYRNFGFNTAGGAITAELPNANTLNAPRVGLRKSSVDANTLTIQPEAGNTLAGEVDSASSHNAPRGPEFSFTASANTWTSERRKRPGVIDYADTDNGAYQIEANGVTSVFRFDTSGGSITATLPASTDPNAAILTTQKFGSDPNTLTILPFSGDTLSGDADASSQSVLAGAFEATTWDPGTNVWSGQELWPTLQGFLAQDLQPGYSYQQLRVYGNVIYATAVAGIKTEEDAFGFTVYRNTLLRPWPGDINGDGTPNTPADGRPRQLGYPGIGFKNRQHNYAEGNVCGGFSSVDVAEDLYVTFNNFTGLDNTLTSYTDVFSGTTEADFNPQTAAAVLAPLRPKVGSSIATNNQGALGVTSATDYYNFETRTFTDSVAPTIATSRQNVPIDQFFWLEFDKPVKLAQTGTITLYNAADDSVVEAFDIDTGYGDAANANGGVPGTVCEGGRRIFIRPTANLTPAANYYIQFGTGVVKTLPDVDFAGISNKTDWAFTAATPSNNILPFGAQDLTTSGIWSTDDVTVTPNVSDWTISTGGSTTGEVKFFLDTSGVSYIGSALTNGQTYTYAWKMKQGTGAAERAIRFRHGLSGTPQFFFDVVTGTWTPNPAVELNVSGPDGEGFYRYMVSWTQSGTRWRPELLFNMPLNNSVVMKEPMLWSGLFSLTGELAYEDPDSN